MPVNSRIAKRGRSEHRNSKALYRRPNQRRAPHQLYTTQRDDGRQPLASFSERLQALAPKVRKLREDINANNLSRLIARLPYELRLLIVEHLDPASFSTISSAYREERSLFPIHLRKLLHDSPFAQAKSQSGNDAYKAYQTVMTACCCLTHSLVDGEFSFDNGYGYTFITLSVSPDFSTCFRLDYDDSGYRVTLWSIMARRKMLIGQFKDVVNAQYIGDGGLAIRFQDNSLRVWTTPYDFGYLDRVSLISRDSCTNCYYLSPRAQISLTRKYLFQRDDSNCSLIQHENLVEKERMLLPACMETGSDMVFSPDERSCVLVNEEGDLFFWMLSHESTPTLIHRRKSRRCCAHTILFSPDSQIITAICGDFYPFSMELWNCSHASDSPIVLRAESLPSLNEPGFYCAAYSSDSRHLMIVVDVNSGDSSILVVFRISGDEMRLLYTQDIGRKPIGPMCTFLNRWVFIGSRCIDMGKTFDCGL